MCRAKPCTCVAYLTWSSQNITELWENPIPILRMKKRRLQMIKQLAQSHNYQMVEWGCETQTHRLAISLCLFSNFVLIL